MRPVDHHLPRSNCKHSPAGHSQCVLHLHVKEALQKLAGPRIADGLLLTAVWVIRSWLVNSSVTPAASPTQAPRRAPRAASSELAAMLPGCQRILSTTVLPILLAA